MIEVFLEKYGFVWENECFGLCCNVFFCVVLLICGFVFVESECVLFEMLEKFEVIFDEVGLCEDVISICIIGCLNGCVCFYFVEIGFVGCVLNKYVLFLGVCYDGICLNCFVVFSFMIDDVVKFFELVIKCYVLECQDGEGFGDFCDCVILLMDVIFYGVGINLFMLLVVVIV